MGNPTVTPLQEILHDFGFIVNTPPNHLHLDTITLTGAARILAGTVLGQVTVGAATGAAVAGNTGNGTMGAVTVSAGAKPGVYKLTLIEPATNLGAFIVEDPTGINIGHGTVGSAFSAGGLAFTLADGATDFVSGDQFNITVAAGSGKFSPMALAGADGTQNAVAILGATKDVTLADKQAVVVARMCEVNASELIWPAGASGGQIAAGVAQLKALTIITR